MARPLLGQLRTRSPLMRSVAAAVIVTFSALITTPAVAAIRAAESRPAQAETRPVSAEKRLATTLVKARKVVTLLVEKLERRQSAASERAQLAQIESALRKLDKAAKRGFEQTGKQLRKKKVPETILERHRQAIETYEARMARTRELLEAIAAADEPGARLRRAKAARDFLDEQKLERSHQPFDPEDLNPAFQADPGNEPKTTKDQYIQAGLHDTPLPRLAALGDFTFDGLPGASDPAYLAETPEVTLTQAVRDKASELGHDPVQIYHWVRNNVQWLPSWGAYQGADLTLSTRRGNAMDIASLTIALLRASGIPARYVHGTIDVPAEKFTNWAGDFADVQAAQEYVSVGGIPTAAVTSGGEVAKIRLEHIWVEAALDYFPSRAAVNRSADAWVSMDPGFKQYEYQQGLDVAEIADIDAEALSQSFLDSGTVNETEGWVQGFDPAIVQNAQTEAQQKLEDYIANQMTDPTVGDVIGGRRTIVEEFPVVPSSLPNRIVVEGARYGELPDPLRNHMSLSFGKDLMGYPIDPLTLPWASINNERITVSFRPATAADEEALLSLLPDGEITDLSQLPSAIPSYLIEVVPELKLNGEVIKTGNPMQLGEELDLVYQVRTPLETQAPYTYKVIAGSYLALAAIGQNVGVQRLSDLQGRLEMTKSKLESQDAAQLASLNREDLLGDLFHAGVLGYFAEYTALSHILALQQRAGQNLAIGYGSYGYEPNVSYLFGMPRAIEPGGVVMNVRLGDYVTTHQNDPEQRVQLRQQLGMLSSALEHAIPEQMFVTEENPGEAISAVKALAKATQQGQRIYHLTPANQATALPNIHHDEEVLDEIRASLAVGKEVITHTDAVSVPGWSGAGYIIMDPETGIGAYKIGGGVNGGYLGKLDESFALLSFIFSALDLKNIPGAAVIAEKFGALGAVFGVMANLLEAAEDCLKTGLSAYIAMVVVTIIMATISIALTALLATMTGGVAMLMYSFLVGSFMDYLLGLIQDSAKKIICVIQRQNIRRLV